MDGYVAEIRHFAANFAPRNWAFCMGQLVAIRSNTALFSLIGTVYGGDGQTTFGLPNLCGRGAIGFGQGPGLSLYSLGETAGTNSVTLTLANLPIHNHTASGSIEIPTYADGGDTNIPTNNVLASKANMYNAAAPDSNMKPAKSTVNVGVAGGSVPLSVTQPSIGINYIICLYGIFPSRS